MIENYKKITLLTKSQLQQIDIPSSLIIDLILDKDTYIIGDLHQDDENFFKILEYTDFFNSDCRLVFLGDYIDRGADLWLINRLLVLRYEYPERVILLRGNHESYIGSKIVPVRDSDFFEELKELSKEYPEYIDDELFKRYYQIFESLPVFVRINYNGLRFLLVHGGIARYDLQKGYPRKFESFLKLKNPIGISYINDFLWSDPDERGEFSSVVRYKFNEREFKEFLKCFNFDYVIRAHEYVKDGFKIDFNRCITIFSSGGDRSAYSGIPAIMHLNSGRIFQIKDKLVEVKKVYFSKFLEKSRLNLSKPQKNLRKKTISKKYVVVDYANNKKKIFTKNFLTYQDLSNFYGIKKDFKLNLRYAKFPYFINDYVCIKVKDGLQRGK